MRPARHRRELDDLLPDRSCIDNHGAMSSCRQFDRCLETDGPGSDDDDGALLDLFHRTHPIQNSE